MPMEAALLLHRQGAFDVRTYRALLDVARQLSLKPVEALVLANFFDERKAAATLAERAVVRCWRSWPALAIAARVRALVPGDVAAEHRIVPLYVNRDGDLTVAMIDPFDELACAEVEFFAGARLERVVVTAPMASSVIDAFYGIVTPFLSQWRARGNTARRWGGPRKGSTDVQIDDPARGTGHRS